MRSFSFIRAVILFVLGVLAVDDTHAQTATNYHTWVSATGTNADTCGAIASPCKSAIYALQKTLPGGAIECKDTLDSLTLDITKSITVICDTAKWSNAIDTGIFTVPVSVNVAATDIVTIRGLVLDGARYFPERSGVTFSGSGTLILDSVQLTGWSGNGVLFQPVGPGKLVVSNSLIAGNGNFSSNTGAGIRIVPQSAGSAQVSISRTDISRNVFGVAADGSNSSAGINVTVTDSISSSNAQDGFIAVSTSAPAGMLLTNAKSTNNGYGVRSIGNNITVRVDNSRIVGNSTGVTALSGGALITGGGNTVQANATNGSFTGSYPLQ